MSDDLESWLKTDPPRSVNNRLAPYFRRMAIEQLARSQNCRVDETGAYVPLDSAVKPPVVAIYTAFGVIAVGVVALLLFKAYDASAVPFPSPYKTYDVAADRLWNDRYNRQRPAIETKKDAIDAILDKLPVSPPDLDPRGDRLGSVAPPVRQWAVPSGD